MTMCRVHYVENVESEALEAVGRWSVIDKVVRFTLCLKRLSEWDCLTESGMSFQILGGKLFCPKLLLQHGTDDKFWLTERRDR